MKGRKAIPNQLKSLRGTNQPVRMRQEYKNEVITKVTAPRELNKRAKKIYRDKANQLIAMKVLNSTDLDQLLIYANSFDMLLESIEKLKEGKFKTIYDENGNIIRFVENPFLKIYRDMVMIVNKIGSDFGFSPVSRQKLSTQKEAPKSKGLEDEIFGL